MAGTQIIVTKEIEAFLAGEKVAAPFELAGEQGSFHCQQVLRYLPGRRLVVKAEHNGQLLLLKLFKPNKKGRRELDREIKGYRACKQAGVAVPEQVLINENLAGCLAIGYTFVSDAKKFELALANDAERVKQLFELMILCHQKGIYQQDIHPDNLLLTPKGLFLIDLASVNGVVGAPLSKEKSLTNLALLIAQFQSEQQDALLQHLAFYFAQRGWPLDKKAEQEFRKTLNKVWQKRKNNYLSKCFRSCTMTAYNKTRQFEYAFKRPFFEAVEADLVNQIDAIVEQGKVLKAGNSATVVLTQLAGKEVVIKRYNIKSFWHFLKRCWRPSRAANAWRYGNLMELIGVPTPEALGFIEKRHGPLRTTAYLVTEFSLGGRELTEVFPEDVPSDSVLKQVQRLFQLMIKYQLSHGDLKASNLLLTAEAGIELIDLDAMQEHLYQSCFKRAYRKDKDRFLRNWSISESVAEAFHEL
jgi:tRNA A-37 threonylcarbamoyl transferase component Bud32